MLRENISASGCKTASGTLPPAAFTNPLIFPKRCKIKSFARFNESSSMTSACTKKATPPFASISFTAARPLGSSLPKITTFPPASAMASLKDFPRIP